MKLSGLPWVSLAALVILVGCLTYFGVLQNFGQPVGPNVYSRSAIGHAGISEILKRRGVPVTASVGASRAKTRRGGLLVLAKKPDRAAGNLSAAGGAAQSVPVQNPDHPPEPGRGPRYRAPPQQPLRDAAPR